jgi:4-hydroxy-tetrahydrodipicolinate synthase
VNRHSVPGVIAPNLTPFNDDLSVATDLYVRHAHDLLDEGCVGLAPFGTTGEALSVGIDERKSSLEALVASGIDPEVLVPGTGLTNLVDTVSLSRHAMDLGCRAVMTLPPFYIKSPSDQGLFDYFEALIHRAGPSIELFLYHIPQVAGVGFSHDLVRQLKTRFPEQVIGIKDSTGDWANTAELFEIDELLVYPGSELPLMDSLALGGLGCISATANTNGGAIAEVITSENSEAHDEAGRLHAQVAAVRRLFDEYPLIASQKWLLARRTGDPRWANVRPPLTKLSDQVGEVLDARLRETTR